MQQLISSSSAPMISTELLVTARFPYDLPRLVKALVKQLVPGKS